MLAPLVTIIIPCYNSELYIAESIESALAQSWPNKEILVVDDGSTDSSASIASNFHREGVILIRQEHRSASAARNAGLLHSSGQYIQFLDADDLLSPNKIELQIGLLQQENNHDCVASCAWGRFEKNVEDSHFVAQEVWDDFDPISWLVCSWTGGGMMHPAAWLTPKSVIDQAGLWNEELSLYDDGEFFCRVVLASKGIRFAPQAKSYYRSNLVDSLSGSSSPLAWESAFSAHDLESSHLLNAEDSPRTQRAVSDSLSRLMYASYFDSPSVSLRAEKRLKQMGFKPNAINGGFVLRLLSRILGWKNAKKLQQKWWVLRRICSRSSIKILKGE